MESKAVFFWWLTENGFQNFCEQSHWSDIFLQHQFGDALDTLYDRVSGRVRDRNLQLVSWCISPIYGMYPTYNSYETHRIHRTGISTNISHQNPPCM